MSSQYTLTMLGSAADVPLMRKAERSPCMTVLLSAQAGLRAMKAETISSNPARQDSAAQSLIPMLAPAAVQQGRLCQVLSLSS